MSCYRSFLSCLVLLTCLLWSPPSVRAETDTITYQGRLDLDNQAVDGLRQISITVWDAASGGVAYGSWTFVNVLVQKGLFTVTLTGPQAVSAFSNGANRWLEIAVKAPSDPSPITLVPRQPVSAAPVARWAAAAGSVTGSVNGSQIVGTISPTLLNTGTITGGLNFNPAGGVPPFAVGNANKVINLNSDLLDGLDSTAFVKRVGDSMTGALDFGSVYRQDLNLWSAGQIGIGAQTNTLYQRSNKRFSWFQGGSPVDAESNPGSGFTLMTLVKDTLTLLPDYANSNTQGPIRLAFGDSATINSVETPYVSIGESDTDDELEIRAKRINLSAGVYANSVSNSYGQLNFGQLVGDTILLWSDGVAGGGDDYAIGIQTGTQYFRSGHHFAWFKGGAGIAGPMDAGTGGTKLMTLDETGVLKIHPLTGRMETPVLTITGGADVAEPFPVRNSGADAADVIAPGSVMIIDESDPGHLKLSDKSYDTRVAGVVSGAGGVQPGLTLRQTDVMEGSHNVALSGRVYVLADASGGPIQPGDLLTTSSTPGHACRVQDHQKAQGAILGKAMGRLESGQGLVLVLVTLQ